MTGSGFRDRHDAGRRLAEELREYAGRKDTIVLALPRGGVPVAYEVARALGAPLDVFVVRKLGVPGHEEFAMGAIASGGTRVLDEHTIHSLGIPRGEVERITRDERRELERRDAVYRGNRPFPKLMGKTVIVVDDGLATGATMRAAVVALRQHEPAAVIAAAPVGARATCAALKWTANDCVCAVCPEPFYGVGLWYDDFAQTTDEEVQELLEMARGPRRPERPNGTTSFATA
ncbi:MAG TPA: phosphoribosyltransferase [Gemmatimonadaceae bacterium]